jgi:glycosyltransferase involved in cell wall biosynthesis
VLDLKDNWELYVPRGLRRLIALRTAGWSAITANSELTREKARIYQRAEATVIYSGINEEFLAAPRHATNERARFVIVIVGSLYTPDPLRSFLKGVQGWHDTLQPALRRKVHLLYAGADHQMFQEAISNPPLALSAAALGRLSEVELARVCASAAANVYVAHGATFHAKLPELLACGRPVLAYPAETWESFRLATLLGGDLRVPHTPAEVSSELGIIFEGWTRNGVTHNEPRGIDALSWPQQTRLLESVLLQVSR